VTRAEFYHLHAMIDRVLLSLDYSTFARVRQSFEDFFHTNYSTIHYEYTVRCLEFVILEPYFTANSNRLSFPKKLLRILHGYFTHIQISARILSLNFVKCPVNKLTDTTRSILACDETNSHQRSEFKVWVELIGLNCSHSHVSNARSLADQLTP
jgi:hypothetical protein